MYSKIKRRTYEILENSENGDKAGKAFDVFIMALIIVNVIMVIVDTFDIPPSVQTFSRCFEVVSVIIFTVEYVLRLWTCDLKRPGKPAAISRLKYIFSFMALIDLLAIMPFYLPMIISIDLRVLRMLRVVRLFRIFKINRYTTALNAITTVFKNKASQLISSMAIVLRFLQG